jgi:hypothetical protein
VNGLLDVTRCNAYRDSIRANTRALAVEEALQHMEEAKRILAQIAADREAGAAIPGCRIPS